MQKIKMYFNKIQIIGYILSSIMVILIPIINNYELVSLGWFVIGITFFGDAKFMKDWSIIGRTWNEKDDKNPEKQLTRKYGDMLFYVISTLALVLCPVALFDNIFSKNYIILIVAYIISTIVLIIILILTDKENKRVEKMIPEIRK